MGPPSLGEGEDTSVPTQKRQDLETKSSRCSPHAVRRDDLFMERSQRRSGGNKLARRAACGWRGISKRHGLANKFTHHEARSVRDAQAQRAGATGASPP